MRSGYAPPMPKTAQMAEERPLAPAADRGGDAPPTEKEQLANIRAKEYVLALLARTGLDLTKLAERAGLHQTTVTRPMNDKTHQHHLTRRTVQRLSEVFGVPVASEVLAGLRAGRATREEALSRPTSPRPRRAAAAAPPLPTPIRDIPIQATPMVGRGSHFQLNPVAMDYAPRLPAIVTARKVFALRMPDGSMDPWRRIGELVFIDPTRPVAPGDHALVQLLEPGNPNAGPIFLIRRVVALPSQPGGMPRLEAYVTPASGDGLDGLQVVELSRALEWPELLGH